MASTPQNFHGINKRARYTEFDPDRTRNVESTGKNSFTPVSAKHNFNYADFR
jgi:hypothetical protein